jgi:hypothetical protein
MKLPRYEFIVRILTVNKYGRFSNYGFKVKSSGLYRLYLVPNPLLLAFHIIPDTIFPSFG